MSGCFFQKHGVYHFLRMICGNNVSLLHRYRNITTFIVYLTACDLDMSFSFDTTIDVTSHASFLVHA